MIWMGECWIYSQSFTFKQSLKLWKTLHVLFQVNIWPPSQSSAVSRYQHFTTQNSAVGWSPRKTLYVWLKYFSDCLFSSPSDDNSSTLTIIMWFSAILMEWGGWRIQGSSFLRRSVMTSRQKRRCSTSTALSPRSPCLTCCNTAIAE